MLIAETEAVQSAEGEFYQKGLYSFEFITGMQDSVGCVCVCVRERERENVQVVGIKMGKMPLL